MKTRIINWFKFKRYSFKNVDWVLVGVVVILSIISFWTLTIVQGDNFSLSRQLLAMFLGFVTLVVFSIFDYHDLCLYVPIIYILATLMVAATKFSPLGDDQGTQSFRWLDFKIIVFQPSEICKVVIILTLATFFAKRLEKIKSLKTFFIACGLTILPTFFILIQSDLSSSVVIIVILVMMLACSGVGRRILGPVAAIVIPLIGAAFWYVQQPGQSLLNEYQANRILGWLDPDKYALNVMYQQNNSVLSIASGKLYGKHILGLSAARNYKSIDVTESDFIWTPISEEFGFLGCMVIIALLSVIIIKCFIAAKKAKDYMGMMIAVGIGAMFTFQVFVNIGVTTSLLPNTGLPLPFLSNGISSLISSMMAVGILINIGIQPNRGSNSFELY